MAERAAHHPDLLLADLLANGAVAGFNSYDGVTFFNASHSSGKSGNQSNILTPAATAPDDPTVQEFRTSLKDGIARLLSFVDDQAEPLTLSATGLVGVVPPTMYLTALEAINATVVDSTTNVLTGAARVIPFSRMTDQSKWFLLKTDAAIRPFVFQLRQKIEVAALEQTSETGFLRDKFLYGARARYAMAFGEWAYALSLDFT